MVSSAFRVTSKNFNEQHYLEHNKDVQRAVGIGFGSGLDHFQKTGKNELRYQTNPKIHVLRRQKNDWVKKLLKRGGDKHFYKEHGKFNYLTPQLKKELDIIDTPNVSSHNYDKHALNMIKKYKKVLDCGAGYRNFYYPNVVNFEIVDYSTTDVLGVGEKLPFKNNSFDAVISIAVLEHVKDPFKCAKEIIRVLRPGGELYCSVPFLQPFHGYPHHYFNMTKSGVRSLFEKGIHIEGQEVIDSLLPIFTLCWIISSWGDGLDKRSRDEFLNMQIKDFYNVMPDIKKEFNRPFVHNLSEEKKFELACGTVIYGKKL